MQTTVFIVSKTKYTQDNVSAWSHCVQDCCRTSKWN